MTEVVGASETTFSRISKPRRKVYGSVAGEEEEGDKLLTTSDFIDASSESSQPNEKSIFDNNDDSGSNDDDDDDGLSLSLSDKAEDDGRAGSDEISCKRQQGDDKLSNKVSREVDSSDQDTHDAKKAASSTKAPNAASTTVVVDKDEEDASSDAEDSQIETNSSTEEKVVQKRRDDKAPSQAKAHTDAATNDEIAANGSNKSTETEGFQEASDSPSKEEVVPKEREPFPDTDVSGEEKTVEDNSDEPASVEDDKEEKLVIDESETSRRSKRARKPTPKVAPVAEVEQKADPTVVPLIRKEQPEEDALVASVDTLFVHADKDTVTVKDIVLALELEFDVKLTKKTKMIVRGRLTNLVQGTVEPGIAGSDKEDESSEEEEVEEEEVEESESEDDFEEEESSDFEEDTKKPKKSRKKKAGAKVSKSVTKKEPRKSSRQASTSKLKKPSAVRIHAEMLRKKRMDELRVRNEELQVQQNKEDQERAEQIAARFDTNTDELRLKRLEDRLDLLQKLDQKRVQVIAGEDEADPVKGVKHEVPSAASTSDSDSDSDSDMELEIIGGDDQPTKNLEPLPAQPTNVKIVPTKRTTAQSKALSILNLINKGQSRKESDAAIKKQASWSETGSKAQASPGQSLSARAALRSTLLTKQRKMGNLWLARELGYKTEHDHLRDCLQVEKQKRVIVIKKEEARLKSNERKQLRERMLLAEEEVADDDKEELSEKTANQAEEDTETGEEEDEEVAMAKEIENEQNEDITKKTDDALTSNEILPEGEKAVVIGVTDGNDDAGADADGDDKIYAGEDDDKTVAFNVGGASDDDRTVAFDASGGDDVTVGGLSSNAHGANSSSPVGSSEGLEIQLDAPPKQSQLSLPREQDTVATHAENDVPTDADNSEHAAGDLKEDPDSGENEFEEQTGPETQEARPKKAKNSGWKEMLKKEAEKAKKLKKRKGSGLVDAEADEEEEEDVVAGLEDFGFSMGKQKQNDDDDEGEDDEFNEEDLKHVVDELSDDEGDEDAGEEARKELQKREEKDQHKEILRRMREGYDGRRGGIAGGGIGARGLHRFDQLVAADNREDAKRLGLLNDDELDSDDEDGEKEFDGKDNAGEIEDETALLDKMLKDRFLHRSSVETEEQFSDEEEEKTNDDSNNGCQKDEDAEEREQELLAKRFAKRARMQRLIETHGGDEEFSQLRLIDEDQSMKKELMSMKDVVGKARRQKSTSSDSLGASSGTASDSQLGAGSNSQSLLGSQSGGSLLFALKGNRKRKNKTSFLGGSAANKEKASQIHKSVALSHVVFSSENSQSLGGPSTATTGTGKRKRKVVASSSLWDKVAANSFRLNKKR